MKLGDFIDAGAQRQNLAREGRKTKEREDAELALRIRALELAAKTHSVAEAIPAAQKYLEFLLGAA